MADQDLYDPNNVFANEEDDVLLAKVALDDLIRNTAVKALNEGLRVKVTTPDETLVTNYWFKKNMTKVSNIWFTLICRSHLCLSLLMISVIYCVNLDIL